MISKQAEGGHALISDHEWEVIHTCSICICCILTRRGSEDLPPCSMSRYPFVAIGSTANIGQRSRRGCHVPLTVMLRDLIRRWDVMIEVMLAIESRPSILWISTHNESPLEVVDDGGTKAEARTMSQLSARAVLKVKSTAFLFKT